MEASYPNTQVRGRMRIWKQQLADLYEPIEFAPDDDYVQQCAADYTRKGSAKGQLRALKKLKTLLGPGATLKAHRLANAGRPYALWRYIAPHATMFPETKDKGKLQDCIAVGYLVITPQIVCRAGLWGLVVPDHALGRAIERSGEISPQRIIETAHDNLLRLRVGAVLPKGEVDPEHRFYLGSDDGCFVSILDYNPTAATRPWVFAHTWISEDMRYEQQILLTEDGLPGEQLGDQWLRPTQLHGIDDKAYQLQFGGAMKPFDMRRIAFTAAKTHQLIEELALCDIVWCDYGDDQGGQFIKGEDRVRDAETDDSTKIVWSWLRVANTTTIELLLAGLDIYQNYPAKPSAYENLAAMLTIACQVPGGLHDDKLFNAAIKPARKH